MKTPHLLASLAVAVTASATELKDPTVVAREWNEAHESTHGLHMLREVPRLRGLPSLLDQSQSNPRTPELPFFSPHKPTPFQVPPWSRPPPRHPGTDIPAEDAPAGPDGKMPRGTKEWKYGGQTYWLMPLIPSRD